MDNVTKIFGGQGRVYVSDGVRQRIVAAYEAAGWRSSRAAAAAARELGEGISHQTIESFLQGKWTSVDRRVLRALIRIHHLDATELADLNDGEHGEDEWVIRMPRRYWTLDHAERERVRRALLAMLDARTGPVAGH